MPDPLDTPFPMPYVGHMTTRTTTTATTILAGLIATDFTLKARRSDAHTILDALIEAADHADSPVDIKRFTELADTIRTALLGE